MQVTLKRSRIGSSPQQKTALQCLGLRKTHRTKKLPDTPCVWGQLKKVLHLVEIKKGEK